MMIDPVTNGFGSDKVRIHLQIFCHQIINFSKILFCIRFSNTSCVESLETFRKLVVENVKLYIDNLMKKKYSKEEKKFNMQME